MLSSYKQMYTYAYMLQMYAYLVCEAVLKCWHRSSDVKVHSCPAEINDSDLDFSFSWTTQRLTRQTHNAATGQEEITKSTQHTTS